MAPGRWFPAKKGDYASVRFPLPTKRREGGGDSPIGSAKKAQIPEHAQLVL